jgi:hypothetical protein
MTANNQMNMTSVFCEINRFLTGGISSSHDSKLLLSKLRGSTVTDGTGADPSAPKLVFLGKV